MSRRTQVFQQLPWSGGLHSALDSGLIPPNDLVQADNVLFSSNSAKVKREDLQYYDALSDIPAVTYRSSSGTTRTLVFASTLSDANIDKLVAGEGINVTTTATSGNEYDYYRLAAGTVATLATTSVSNDTLTYTGTGSLSETSTATTTCTVTRAYPIVLIKDYWRFTGSANAQLIVATTSQPLLFKYDSSGRRKAIAKDATATARAGTAVKQCAITFNETLIIGQTRLLNKPLKYKPETDTEWLDLGGTPPDFSICTGFLNRVWTNDKNNPDRLHYSSTGNAEEWQGTGDSGALDIRPGDGDPQGIVSIYAFKGRLFVAKKGKMYQVVGDSPENFQVLDVSSGLGTAGQLAGVPIDQDDFVYASSKGIHSLSTTSSYSDFQATYLSSKIQPTFNDWQQARLEYMQAAYIPTLNSIFFMISESDANLPDALYIYHTQSKEWSRWPVAANPGINPTAIAAVNLSGTPTLFIGTDDGKLVTAQNGGYTDFDTAAIRYRVKSGTIYPDNTPMSLKRFLRITLFYRPVGTYTATVKVKIDNYSEQQLTFSQVNEGDLLGSTFILGSSVLGASAPFSPFTASIDGIGHGCTIEVEQTGTEEQLAIYGYAIEWEAADISQETTVEAQ